MRVTIAMDSFKGSLSSRQCGEAVSEGIRRVFPDAVIKVVALADGGEGTAETLTEALKGETVRVCVTGPLGTRFPASYGIVRDRGLALIDAASAAGLTLISPEDRNPMDTTTYGIGEMILDAAGRGCRDFIIGLGGSSTNDGGAGMLSALGYAFLDRDGRPVHPGAYGLRFIDRIDTSAAAPVLKDCRFRIACDVKNPLCGENGSSAVYSPQKGARPEDIPLMDSSLSLYAEKIGEVFPGADPDREGAGAAGGLGFAFQSVLGAETVPGVELVLEISGAEELFKNSDIVVTGEGRLDFQSAFGKAPVGVGKTAGRHGVPVISLSGCVGPGAGECNSRGIDAFFPVLKGPCTVEEAMDPVLTYENTADAAEQVFRLIRAVR